jgi:hypothetical protein
MNHLLKLVVKRLYQLLKELISQMIPVQLSLKVCLRQWTLWLTLECQHP